MTEMVFGAVSTKSGEPIISRWWRTVDRVSLFAVVALFAVGILLGLASSPPLAERNGLGAFHYVNRQMIFGVVALSGMVFLSMQSPKTVRRLAVLGFIAADGCIRKDKYGIDIKISIKDESHLIRIKEFLRTLSCLLECF